MATLRQVKNILYYCNLHLSPYLCIYPGKIYMRISSQLSQKILDDSAYSTPKQQQTLAV
jgi:hypothetical protein